MAYLLALSVAGKTDNHIQREHYVVQSTSGKLRLLPGTADNPVVVRHKIRSYRPDREISHTGFGKKESLKNISRNNRRLNISASGLLPFQYDKA